MILRLETWLLESQQPDERRAGARRCCGRSRWGWDWDVPGILEHFMSQKLWEMISLGSLYRLWMLRSGSCIAACTQWNSKEMGQSADVRYPTPRWRWDRQVADFAYFPWAPGESTRHAQEAAGLVFDCDLIWFRSLGASHTILEKYPLNPAEISGSFKMWMYG